MPSGIDGTLNKPENTLKKGEDKNHLLWKSEWT